MKKPTINNTNENEWVKESGVIVQQIWYDVPELRHLVDLPPNANPVEIDTDHSQTSDPKVDRDYTNLGWGEDPAMIKYSGFIPYLIGSIKELSQKNEEIIKKMQDLSRENEVLCRRVDILES